MLAVGLGLAVWVFQGGLLAELAPAGVGLTDAPSTAAPLEESARLLQLRTRWDQLEAVKPGVGGPLGLMAGGAGLGVVGLVLFSVLPGSAQSVAAALTAVMLTAPLIWVGAAVLVAGVVMLGMVLKRRAEVSTLQRALGAEGQLPAAGGPRPEPGGSVALVAFALR